jgi:uncharacterized protein affecting Mg2+/Co2+ transport
MVSHGTGPAISIAPDADDGVAFDVAVPAFSLDSPHQSGRLH